MYNISNTIRKLMIDKKTTVTELSQKMNVLQPSISRKINNPDSDYKISLLSDLCSAMDCDITITISDKQTGKALYTLTDEQEHA